ncbi:hypothetical protein F5B18DRAFT_655568 [Nemania serpens]|nr:hypothetical protein F5B18DRAFT_655568 [Nemania serpens]
MSPPVSSLNNGHLHENPLPSAEYNKLPNIDKMADAAANNAKAHAILLGVIAAHGLADKFSVHLTHKHFDLPEGRVMVYEMVKGKSHEDFILCSPRIPQKTPNMRGLYFKAALDGNMIAYEFTTNPGMDLSDHKDFVAKFATAVLELGVQDVFALTALSICPKEKVFTEFELGQVLSTVLVANSSWLPAQDVAGTTNTDWLATADYAQYADGLVPGIIQLKCTDTRPKPTQSRKHFNFTCSTTRTGKHLGHAPASFVGQPPQDNVLRINGEVLPEGTEGHAIVSRALQMIDVA